MATTINAGRVRFVSRGTYNNSTQYYLFDLVDYNGSSYIAKENSLGNLPTNTQYWQLIAEKGNTGSTGQTGPVGPTGNGIASITKTGTSGLVDTYTITYTNGNTTTFTVTNGEDGEVTETELNVLRQKVANQQKVIDQLPQVEGQGTSITLENTIEAPFTKFDVEGNSTQDGTPSPDNEVPILSAGDNGSINEVVCNKNFANVDVEQGAISAKEGKDYASTKENNNTRIRTKDLIKLDTSKTYTINFNKKYNVVIQAFNSNKLLYSSTDGIANVWHTNSFNFSGYPYVAVAIRNNDSSNITPSEIEKVKLSLSETDKTQTYTIPTQQPMRSIGDVRDKFVKVDGNWFERHYISRKIFDGTEDWTKNTTIDNTFFTNKPQGMQANETRLMSNITNWFGISYYNSKDCVIAVGNSFNIKNANISTVDDLKAWLTSQYNAGTPVYVDYVSDTPIDIECTETQIQQLENIPSTYKDFTIIQSQDETEAYLEVSGIYDLNNLINN